MFLFLFQLTYLSRHMTKPRKWLCAQQRLRSAWASAFFMRTAKTLSLRWVHMPFCWFCHKVAQFKSSTVNSNSKNVRLNVNVPKLQVAANPWHHEEELHRHYDKQKHAGEAYRPPLSTPTNHSHAQPRSIPNFESYFLWNVFMQNIRMLFCNIYTVPFAHERIRHMGIYFPRNLITMAKHVAKVEPITYILESIWPYV